MSTVIYFLPDTNVTYFTIINNYSYNTFKVILNILTLCI